VNHYLEHGQGFRAGEIDAGFSFTVPAAAIQAGAFPIEGCLAPFSLDESVCTYRAHAKTPCSSRPIRFNTASAPAVVATISTGLRSPRPRTGLRSQRLARSRLPSKRSTALL